MNEVDFRTWYESSLLSDPTWKSIFDQQLDERGYEHEHIFLSQAALVRWLVATTNAKDVLELGTFLGYSTAVFAEALDTVEGAWHLTTVEIDAERSRLARSLIETLGFGDRVEFLVTDAKSASRRLGDDGRSYDIILLDTAERDYPELFPWLVLLLRQGGVLIIDNVLMELAAGWSDGNNVVEAPHAGVHPALRRLLELATSDERVTTVLLPSGSGILLCTRHGSESDVMART